jgi:hypothetical protein
MFSAVEAQCSWLIGRDKTAVNIGAHFQCKMPICFQDLMKCEP